MSIFLLLKINGCITLRQNEYKFLRRPATLRRPLPLAQSARGDSVSKRARAAANWHITGTCKANTHITALKCHHGYKMQTGRPNLRPLSLPVADSSPCAREPCRRLSIWSLNTEHWSLATYKVNLHAPDSWRHDVYKLSPLPPLR